MLVSGRVIIIMIIINDDHHYHVQSHDDTMIRSKRHQPDPRKDQTLFGHGLR